MSIYNRFEPLSQSIDLVLAEQRELAATGPRLTIWHRFQDGCHNGDCHPGEEIFLIAVSCAAGHVPLKLSLALKIVTDYLARHRRIPQSASQIEAGIRADLFYAKHGRNATANGSQTRKICRSAVRVYVERLRRALKAAFVEAGLRLDPRTVLVSEPSEGNQVLYRLKATVDWYHIRLQSSNTDGTGM